MHFYVFILSSPTNSVHVSVKDATTNQHVGFIGTTWNMADIPTENFISSFACSCYESVDQKLLDLLNLKRDIESSLL